jgi:hypothetical protein
MSDRENYLRCVEMRGPERIPCHVGVHYVWFKYREALEDLVLEHPIIFGNYERGSTDFDNLGIKYSGNLTIDEWKCVWGFIKDGIMGQVVENPIDSWEKFEDYRPPDYPLWGPPTGGGSPIGKSWSWAQREMKEARENGELTSGGLPHGFMWMRLHYLRGFANLMMDFVREDPRLQDLIDMVKEKNIRVIDRWLEIGPPDVMVFGDDLGAQDRMPIRPDLFRKYLIPAYEEMFDRIRDAGCHVYLHSDGYFLEVMGDLIDAGVTILNPQDRIHGLETLRDTLEGRVCIDLDIDRQHLMPRGTPEQIDQHIDDAVRILGSEKGGLMLKAGIYDDVPLENIDALCSSMEKRLVISGH